MLHDLASGSEIFQPSNVLPSKIWTKPSSESAAESAVAVANARSEPIRSFFIGGRNKAWFSARSQLLSGQIEGIGDSKLSNYQIAEGREEHDREENDS